MSAGPEQSPLSPEDRRLLDLLVEGGFDPAALEELTPDEKRRVDAIVGLFELLEDYPVEDADESLVYATLARIDRQENEASARLVFDALSAESGDPPRKWRFRIPDFISIAAVILIATSVIWPTAVHLRQRNFQTGCANNLRLLSYGFSQYADDNEAAMPMAMANFGPDWSWGQVRNSLNLRPLIDGGYCELRHLNCPGNHDLDPSYSYQWLLSGRRAVWNVGRVTIVLGDRNPIIDLALSGRPQEHLRMSSLNHNGRGQNVLGTDGRDLWLEQPVVPGGDDNIWVPKGVSQLRVGDRPTDPADVFLAH